MCFTFISHHLPSDEIKDALVDLAFPILDFGLCRMIDWSPLSAVLKSPNDWKVFSQSGHQSLEQSNNLKFGKILEQKKRKR